ncbi:MAG: hypothetical protein ACI9C4_001455 [Paraglaciecola sp.]|jgi:hypothetical protein
MDVDPGGVYLDKGGSELYSREKNLKYPNTVL